MIFYPHYCYDCSLQYITKERLEVCVFCGKKNVKNCYGESFDEKEKGDKMIDYMRCLKEFHKTFKCIRNEKPTIIPADQALGRLRLIQEELSELTEAIDKQSLIGIADAVGDLLYVTFGAAVAYGLPMDKIFEEIHCSNMTKIGGHMEGGKWIKPSNYQEANIGKILRDDQLNQ